MTILMARAYHMTVLMAGAYHTMAAEQLTCKFRYVSTWTNSDIYLMRKSKTKWELKVMQGWGEKSMYVTVGVWSTHTLPHPFLP